MSLSACIGSGNGEDPFDPWTTEEIKALNSRAAAAVEPTEALSGTATMSGVIALDVESAITDGDTLVLGDMDVTADFDQSEITGSATNLAFYTHVYTHVGEIEVGEVTRRLTGQLDLDGTITDTNFLGDLDGNLSANYSVTAEGVEWDVNVAGAVDTEVVGEFLSGDAGLAVQAVVSGGVVFSGTQTAVGETFNIEEYLSPDELTESVTGGFYVTE